LERGGWTPLFFYLDCGGSTPLFFYLDCGGSTPLLNYPGDFVKENTQLLRVVKAASSRRAPKRRQAAALQIRQSGVKPPHSKAASSRRTPKS
jgi:hypothetical protein